MKNKVKASILYATRDLAIYIVKREHFHIKITTPARGDDALMPRDFLFATSELSRKKNRADSV